MKEINTRCGEASTSVSQPIHYNSIDGLRALSCLGIIIMHVNGNSSYQLQGNYINDTVLPSFTWLVYLFLIISGFGMCAGYLNKFQNGSVDLESFYKRRYAKILPFFGLLLIIALFTEHNLNAVYEASVEVFMMHGFLPNNSVSVVGVCWTLGVIFVFYLLFPAFSVLMKTKKRAWISFLISLWISFVCNQYFFTEKFVVDKFNPRTSFIYCLPLFIGGGIIYLYRDKIKAFCSKFRWIALSICILSIILWYVIPIANTTIRNIESIVLFCFLLSYAIGVDSKFLSNKLMKFLSGISMEMYLAHMVIFRIIEKANLLYLFGNSGIGGWLSLITAFILTVIVLIIFIQCYKFAFKFVKKHFPKRKSSDITN